MQENHSFDNYFGTYPGADGIPDGVCMPVEPANTGDSECIKPFHIGNRAITDLDHSYPIHVEQYDGGKMDGFVSAFTTLGKDGTLAMGYYDNRDLPFYWNIANDYVLFDRFFTSAAGGSVRNHNYWVMGQPGVPNVRVDSIPKEGWGDLPTIFDRLEASGVSWKFYIQNYDPTTNFRNRGNGDRAAQVVWCPLLNFPRFLDDPTLNAKIVDLNQYFIDLQNNELPAVAFIVPSGASEHPPGSILAGQRFVKKLLNALMQSPAWESSAFMWTYDDWGGWYDHVVPPSVDDFGYGFRAPALLVSPYAKQGYIDSTVLDFTSMLKFIEENWGVEPLAARDRAASNFLDAFDFIQKPRAPRIIPSTLAVTPPPAPRRSMIYASYFAALAVSGMVIGSAFARPPLPGPVRRLAARALGGRRDLEWTLIPWHLGSASSATGEIYRPPGLSARGTRDDDGGLGSAGGVPDIARASGGAKIAGSITAHRRRRPPHGRQVVEPTDRSSMGGVASGLRWTKNRPADVEPIARPRRHPIPNRPLAPAPRRASASRGRVDADPSRERER
jgi:phospholipase C